MLPTWEGQALLRGATRSTLPLPESGGWVLPTAYFMRHNSWPAWKMLLAINAIALWILRAALHVSISQGNVPEMPPAKLAAHGWIQFTGRLVLPFLCGSFEANCAEFTPLKLDIVDTQWHMTLALQCCLEQCAAMLAVALSTDRLVALQCFAHPLEVIIPNEWAAAMPTLDTLRNAGACR